MSRKFIYGLALAGGLALGVFGGSGSAVAQSAPLCSTFGPDSASLDSWGPCPGAPNIVVTTSNVGSIGGPTDYYLRLRDTAGASAACSTNQKYLGNWIEKMGGCGQFCFDFKVIKSGTPPGPITPSFTIWSGLTARATFVANFTVMAGDAWRHICAPVNLSDTPPANADGHWVVTGGTWNAIASAVTMMQLPIDWTSDPSEEAGYDNLCMNPKTCDPPPPVIDGCLKDSKVTVKCNPDGTYTVTLSGGSFTGNTITLTSQTPGVTVTPSQQPWAATTTWTVTGATAGQTVVLTANATKVGGGSEPGTDQCCSGEIKIVMPECPKGTVVVEKKVKNNTEASNAAINALVFPIGLSCGLPSTLNVSFGLNNGGSHTETNIPYTSLCTVTEAVSTLPPVPKDACGQGTTAVWATPVITPPSATINAPITAFTVVNELNCVKAGILVVEKKVENNTKADLSTWTYPVIVTCGGTSATTNLPDGGTVTDNVPIGTSCNANENTLPVPANACPEKGTAPVWSTSITPSVIIGSTPSAITVKNKLDCRPVEGKLGDLIVLKQVKNMTQGNVTGWTYPVNVTCGTTPTLNLADNQSQTVSNLPLGTSCSASENTLPVPANACSDMTMPVWQTVVTPPNVTIGTSPVTIAVQNTLVCQNHPIIACPPGTVLVGRECVKPPTCQPPMVPGPVAGQCICGPGYTLRGKECVKTIVCRPPLVPNAAGTDCVCRPGLVLRRGKCVEPVVCRSPAKLNSAGTACTCPRDMTKKGNSCVEKEKKGPRVTPSVVINGIGVIRGIGGGGDRGGGGASGPSKGGGASPGKP